MILGDDGQKLSKRHGAVSVMQYDEDGYLPEAVINYLARLGWSHGDDEIFSVAQFCEWFDLDHITPSAAQFNTEKLNWLNSHYLKQADNARLSGLVRPRLQARGVVVSESPALESIIALYKERVATLNELADAAEVFYIDLHPEQELLKTHLTAEAMPALQEMLQELRSVSWEAPAIGALIKAQVAKHGLKMPKLAMPLRVMLVGQTQTPSVDAVVSLFPREMVLARLQRHLG
jgi:glutamyl-tRNA synthetase